VLDLISLAMHSLPLPFSGPARGAFNQPPPKDGRTRNGRLRIKPAMAAVLTDHIWELEEPVGPFR
jgi:hypothetical protein